MHRIAAFLSWREARWESQSPHRAPDLDLLAGPIWVLSHQVMLAQKGIIPSCNLDIHMSSSHTVPKHAAPCLWHSFVTEAAIQLPHLRE